ncbi:MAG TPA: VWA domain-containing protein [Pyrinomonadaceae bacterium]|nr:VWA domain-containing protein [Pyrinomonadaceae bacterium]
MIKRGILLSLLVLSLIASVNGQRPRRVGEIEPNSETAQPRPPVLQGNTRPNQSPTNPAPPVADEGPEEVEAGDVIRVNTTLVTIPLSVMDRDGRYIPNLKKEDFRLWEDGVEQQVAYFSSVDKPFSLVLMIDTSGSTRFRLEDIQDAAIAFINQLRPDDQVMVVSFDDDVSVLSEFTNNRSRLRDAIRRTRTGGGTKLYDALDLVINQRLSRLSGRKAVVLFSDGVDTTSRRSSYHDNIRDAEELDALIYPIQYDTYADVGGGGGTTWPGSAPTVADILGQILGGGIRRGGRIGRGGRGTSRRDYELANQYLRELAERTGARQYNADTTQNLSYAFSNIAEELRRQYSLGYYPKRSAQAGERRQIRVRVSQPNLAVRARDSYVFNPTGNTQDTASKSAPVLRRNMSGGSGRWP